MCPLPPLFFLFLDKSWKSHSPLISERAPILRNDSSFTRSFLRTCKLTKMPCQFNTPRSPALNLLLSIKEHDKINCCVGRCVKEGAQVPSWLFLKDSKILNLFNNKPCSHGNRNKDGRINSRLTHIFLLFELTLLEAVRFFLCTRYFFK